MTEQKQGEKEKPLVWRGPAPYLSIKVRPFIPTDAAYGLSVTFVRPDMSKEVDGDGIYEIPSLLAAPIFVLLKKEKRYFEHFGPSGSFISKLEYPTRIKPMKLSLDYIYNVLKEAPTCSACETFLDQCPPRMVFEVLVLIIQQMRLNFRMSPTLTDFMTKVDFGAPYLWNPAAGVENEFKKYMEDKNLTEDELLIRLANKVADNWAMELGKPVENENERLLVQFIMANLTRMVGSYLRALNTQFPNDRHLSIKVNKGPDSKTNPQIQVLGLKLGRFLVTLDEKSLKNKFNEPEAFYHHIHTLPATIIKNLLLLNTPELFKINPKGDEYLFHDKEGCNSENPECVCRHKSME